MNLESQLSLQQGLDVTVWPSESGVGEIIFSCKILERDWPFFFIDVPPELEEDLAPLMVRGTTIGVMAQSQSPIIFYPKVEHFQEKPPRGYWLKLPPDDKFEVVQRRSYVRIEMMVPVQIGDAADPSVRVKGMTLDMSGGGMKLSTPRPFQPQQEVLIYIRFTPEQPIIQLPATVIFSTGNKWSRSPQDAYITACRFRTLSAQQQAAIIRECFRRELSLKNR